jgi:hypothetical protein
LHLTVSRRFLSKLEAAKDALSHAHPGATSDQILEACLDAVLAQRAKRHGLVEKPRAARGRPAAPGVPIGFGARDATPTTAMPPCTSPVTSPAISKQVPASVKRDVWKRAGGRCEWKFASGEACGATVRLEYDHVTPRALGGPSTIDNVRLLCHNPEGSPRSIACVT